MAHAILEEFYLELHPEKDDEGWLRSSKLWKVRERAETPAEECPPVASKSMGPADEYFEGLMGQAHEEKSEPDRPIVRNPDGEVWMINPKTSYEIHTPPHLAVSRQNLLRPEHPMPPHDSRRGVQGGGDSAMRQP